MVSFLVRSFVTVCILLWFVVGDAFAQLPSGWTTQDVGAVGTTGSVATSNGLISVAGAGSDVWGTADAFRFAYTQLTGDGSIVSRVTAIDAVNDWTKAGVMMRETLSAGARHAFMLASPAKGLAFQRRTASGGSSRHTSGGSGTAPYFLKLTRAGGIFTAYTSRDGVTWTTIGSEPIAMPLTIYVGLAVSSHVEGKVANATFSDVNVAATTTSAPSPSLTALPTGWSARDVGGVAKAGSAAFANDTFTVAGSGADIWASADEFHLAYTPLTGDGSIVSQVSALDRLDSWTKAGVMMRETLAAGSRHAVMLVSAGKGLAFQRRTSTGGTSVHTSGGSGTTPYFVKLTRAGSTFTAFKSLDGVNWTKVGSESISMAATIYVGLAVSSHVDGSLATASFSETTVTAGTTAPPPSTSTAETSIRVLHWNLHHGNDPNNKWAFDRQMDVIYQTRADVISLNEVEKYNSSYGNIDQAAEIAKYLTAKTGKAWYRYMVVGSGASKGIGNAVLSRFPLSGQNVCQLSSSRNAVHATMTINNRTFNFWSTHLAVDSSAARVAEAKALLSCMANHAQQRVVAGDFNAGTGTTEVNLMVSGHVDGWAYAKSIGQTTNYSGNCDGCTRNSRIDYMFSSKEATNLIIKHAQILDTRNADGVMASDHKPLVVTYVVK